MTDVKSATAATSRSVMQIGSVTKQFTAAAILRLAERGLDARRSHRNVRILGNSTREARTSHFGTSSTTRQEFVATGGPTRPPLTRPCAGHARARPQGPQRATLPFRARQGLSYSNAGYMLLGYAIESITGRSLADFIHGEFAVPLGLPIPACAERTTCRCLTVTRYSRHRTDRRRWRRGSRRGPRFVGSGSLCSTAFDLSRWSHFLANGGSCYQLRTRR